MYQTLAGIVLLFCRAKWAKVGGTVYKNCIVVLKVEDDFPQFAYVEEIVVGHDSLVHFVVNVCDTSFFSNQFHAYVFVRSGAYSFVSQASLEDPLPLHARRVSGLTRGGQRAVVIKNHYSTL